MTKSVSLASLACQLVKTSQAQNVLKWNHALGLKFNIQSSGVGATTVAKVNLISLGHGVL